MGTTPDIESQPEENFEDLFEDYSRKRDDFVIGDKVTGKIVFLSDENAFVDISGKAEAVIELKELRNREGALNVKEGDEIVAYVSSTRGGEIHLTTGIGKSHAEPDLVKTAYQNRIPVYGTVTGQSKGGYIVSVSGMKCFCPFSQLTTRNPDELINSTLSFLITQFDERGKNIVLSRRQLVDQEREVTQESLKKSLKTGDILKGTVSAVKDFGLFIDIGGFEAFVPKSELSRSRYVRTADFSQEKKITAKVKAIDWDHNRITLSIKDMEPDPWDEAVMLQAGEHMNGRVVGLIKSGAFVELKPGLEGYIPLSRMSITRRITRPENAVNAGTVVSVKIIEIDREKKKISLELLTGEADPWELPYESLMNSIQECVVEAARSNGITVRLANGMLGFVPREELGAPRQADVQKEYQTGRTVKAVILKIEKETRKLILSEKGAFKKEEQIEYQKFAEGGSGQDSSLGSLFKNKFDDIKKKIGNPE